LIRAYNLQKQALTGTGGSQVLDYKKLWVVLKDRQSLKIIACRVLPVGFRTLTILGPVIESPGRASNKSLDILYNVYI
jgi:hypothetical protein